MATHGQATNCFAVEAVWCGPAKLDGFTCKQGCFCADGAGYTIKTAEPDPRTPHNEWLCSHLAVRAGLRAPGFNAVRHTDGNIWFGSAWITGEIKQWWQRVFDGGIPISELSSDLSKIFVFDLFIHNTDRRLSNFLVKKEGPSHCAYALDYTRAWSYHGFPLPDLPFHGGSNTMIAHRALRATCGDFFIKSDALSTLEKLESIETGQIAEILNRQPESWSTKAERQAILEWWGSGQANSRLDAIRRGIGEGNFL